MVDILVYALHSLYGHTGCLHWLSSFRPSKFRSFFSLAIPTLPCSLLPLLPLPVSMAVCTMVAPCPGIRSQFPPKSCEQFECRPKLHPEPAGEVALCEQGEAAPVQLVVQEHLQHTTVRSFH